MSALTPIPFIGKVREKGKKGAPSWPLFVWEMLFERLVNGTPPRAVNANIRSIVERVSPGTEMRQLPSIWTIRCERTVLLTVVQLLAAYRLAKAGKWGQLKAFGISLTLREFFQKMKKSKLCRPNGPPQVRFYPQKLTPDIIFTNQRK